jgi:hypothetical protein
MGKRMISGIFYKDSGQVRSLLEITPKKDINNLQYLVINIISLKSKDLSQSLSTRL